MKNKTWLNNIKVLVWDLDGTLYKEIPNVKAGIHRNIIIAIAKTKKISLNQAEVLFAKNYQKFKSNTKVLLKLGVDKEYIKSGGWYNKIQLQYLKKDPLLVDIFKKLHHLKHIISTNSERQITFKKLRILGLDYKIFSKIFTATETKEKVKPDPYAFKIVLELTKLKPNQHLFLGDSEGKEIIPAKKLGMHTCFVWGKSQIADISVKTVYDVVKLFL